MVRGILVREEEEALPRIERGVTGGSVKCSNFCPKAFRFFGGSPSGRSKRSFKQPEVEEWRSLGAFALDQ